jgi:hypothetical protein
MHQLFENVCPKMFLHWKGTFKDLSLDDPYVLSDEVWQTIGAEGFKAS